MKKVNIFDGFDRIGEHWSPHVAARFNGQEARLVKIEGSFDWHHHDGVDEVFFVIRGSLVMRLRDGDIEMREGDLLVVPAGVEHMPHADEECWIMLFETAGTRNTGDIETARTRYTLPEL